MTAESYDLIISAEDLLKHLNDPKFVIVDCRFNLAEPDWGAIEYQALHIPGAVYADLDHDLAAPRTSTTGRHPLPSEEQMVTVFSRLGIDHSKQVICYDATSGSFAARLWFMLKFCGHETTAVLDGGFVNWHARGYPIESGINTNPPANFIPKMHPEMIVDTADVESLHLDTHWRLIDARAPERYAGINEPIDPVSGHIPGALNRFHEWNLNADGLFKSPGELRKEFAPLVDPEHPENTIAYCGSGVTSAHHLIAMRLAGFPMPKLYVGSWSEWIRDPARPIKVDKTP
ncbi:MAG: sulfurtransferase [Anaerolineaceae bacterium]